MRITIYGRKTRESSLKGANKPIWLKKVIFQVEIVHYENSQLPTNNEFTIPEIFPSGFLDPLAILTEVWIPEQDKSERTVCVHG